MVDSFATSSALWIVLPNLIPFTRFDLTLGNAVQLCWDLISGLAYLHGQLVAHRDIKPNNLVIDVKNGPCFKIIDFDLAIQLSSHDELISDYCGTEGWLAPEIKEESPRPKYNPIKADRWACGRVMSYFLDRVVTVDDSLRSLTKQLMDVEPEHRPSLVEIQQRDPSGSTHSTHSTQRVSIGRDSELQAPKRQKSRAQGWFGRGDDGRPWADVVPPAHISV